MIASGSGFITFLGSYNLFIAPICAVGHPFDMQRRVSTDSLGLQIIIVDYFLVKKGNIYTPALFDPSHDSLYFCTRGWNLKALCSWVSAAVLGIPGLVGAYHPTWVSLGAIHLYQTGWVVCFAVAAVLYFVSCQVFARQVVPAHYDKTESRTFESMAGAIEVNDGESDVGMETLSVPVGSGMSKV